jgi:hypothetical protein
MAYGTRLEDEIIASAQMWHDGALIAADSNQRTETTSAANGLADAKKKNQDQYTATVGQISAGAAVSSSIDIGSAPLVAAAVVTASGKFQSDVSAARGAFDGSVALAAGSFDAIMKSAGNQYSHAIADADAALSAAEAAAAAARAAAETAAEQSHRAAIASAKAGLAETKAKAQAAYEQSLAAADAAYAATVSEAAAVHDRAVAVAKAAFDFLTAQARDTWELTNTAANGRFISDSAAVRADEANTEKKAIAVFSGAVTIASDVHDAAVARAAADRATAIAAAGATNTSERAAISGELAKKVQTLALTFAAEATAIEKRHRGAETDEAQALNGSMKAICDGEAAALQGIQTGLGRTIAGQDF